MGSSHWGVVVSINNYVLIMSDLFFIISFFRHLLDNVGELVDVKKVGGSSMIGIALVIAVNKRDMPGIEPGVLVWHTSALTNKLQND